MTKFTIDLPATFAVMSRDIGVEVKVDDLSADIIGKLALHGLTQKVGDSAASALKDAGFEGRKFADLTDGEKAKVREHAKSAMQGTVDALLRGEWTERRAGGESLGEVERRMLKLFGEFIRENAADVWKETFKPLEGAERAEKLLAFMRGQEDDFKAELEASAKAELDRERATAKKLGGLKLAIKV